MQIWFKRHYQEDWRRGIVKHWATMSEKVHDYAYSEPSAVVEEISTGWIYVVECGFLSTSQEKPIEIQRPEVDQENMKLPKQDELASSPVRFREFT